MEPVLEFRRTIGEVEAALLMYGHLSAEPLQGHLERGEERDEFIATLDEGSRVLRQRASELLGRANRVPFYWLAALWRLVPRRSKVLRAAEGLADLGWNFMSGLHDQTRNTPLRQEIRSALGLDKMDLHPALEHARKT
jgi:hypothetical protein